MKIFVLGSCSGTEPFENRHHTALVLELNGQLFWFDAGETCSYTAHLMGLDLLRVSDIFISHAHMDHIGGLANLLWTIRKLSKVKKELPHYGDLRVHIPNQKSWEGILTILENSEGGYKNDYDTEALPVHEGIMLENNCCRFSALANRHLKPVDGKPLSFSFLIEAEGKRIVYSGDLKEFSELSPWLAEGCDLLLMETGHHCPDEICKQVIDKGYPIKKIGFFHHGRAILNNYDQLLTTCKEIFSDVIFCNDRDVLEI